MTKIVITGGGGFVGHHVVEHFLKNTDWEIHIFDKLTYASSGLDWIRDINAFWEYGKDRVRFWSVDLGAGAAGISQGVIRECKDANYILHLAAESHVDKSIEDPYPFVMSNVVGTMHILEFAKQCENLKAFVYFSTDEVFGPAAMNDIPLENPSPMWNRGLFLKDVYAEWDRYNSTNPYSATKAGGEELVLAYMNTYGIPGFITHCMNIFGERQHPEKFIPMVIRKVLHNEEVTIHGTPDGERSGSRFYIHARNVANAIHYLLWEFEQRDKYNIVGEKELTNLELAQKIADILGKKLYYNIVDFHSSRPGHDLRYGLDGTKLKKMGYEIPVTIDESLKSTVEWTLKNSKWLYV